MDLNQFDHVKIPILLQTNKLISEKAKYFYMCWLWHEERLSIKPTIKEVSKLAGCSKSKGKLYVKELIKHGAMVKDVSVQAFGHL